MRSAMAFVAALLLAGFWLAMARPSRAPGEAARAPPLRRWAGIAAAVAVTVPVGLILLAKLFGSDVLGWMFGLTLLAGFALVPCLAVFAIGWFVGRIVGRRRARQAQSAAPTLPTLPTLPTPSLVSAADIEPRRDGSMLKLCIDRDSVHASDDESHAETLIVSPALTWLELLEIVRQRRYLPGISGGEATWLLECREPVHRIVGVCAQQWRSAQLLEPNATLGAQPRDRPTSLHFKYLCQEDPNAVLARERGRLQVA